MKLFLIILEHNHDEGDVFTPILTPAVDAEEADRIATTAAAFLGSLLEADIVVNGIHDINEG